VTLDQGCPTGKKSAEVSEIVRDPTTRTYTALKSAIMKRFAQTGEDRLNRILVTHEMGDKTPSQLLREIQRLADDDVHESIIRSLRNRHPSPSRLYKL
jgi:hypothetical protein